MVVKVVSHGRVGNGTTILFCKLRQRKRAQSSACGIPEYWIVDPFLSQALNR
ncbi:hypothetical protein QT989_12140 [Microcoleus sp. SVA1_B6]